MWKETKESEKSQKKNNERLTSLVKKAKYKKNILSLHDEWCVHVYLCMLERFIELCINVRV